MHIDNKAISRLPGAQEPLSKAGRAVSYRHCGEKVKKGDTLYTFYSNSREKLGFAVSMAKRIRLPGKIPPAD
jgi:thymidine phosphorylase